MTKHDFRYKYLESGLSAASTGTIFDPVTRQRISEFSVVHVILDRQTGDKIEIPFEDCIPKIAQLSAEGLLHSDDAVLMALAYQDINGECEGWVKAIKILEDSLQEDGGSIFVQPSAA